MIKFKVALVSDSTNTPALVRVFLKFIFIFDGRNIKSAYESWYPFITFFIIVLIVHSFVDPAIRCKLDMFPC